MMRPTSSFGGDRYQNSQGYNDQNQGQKPRASTDIELRRERSKSLASIPYRPPQAQILHYGKSEPFGPNSHLILPNRPNRLTGNTARAMYSYTAAIPEELSFSKGDILAVLRLQDDGWWEAEVKESSKGTRGGGIGLVPSNYLQRC